MKPVSRRASRSTAPRPAASKHCRRYALGLAALLVCGSHAWAHSPLFDCFDNRDGTITCEGGFSDGASAEGIAIQLIDARGKVLEQGKLDSAGAIVLQKPKGEYTVVFSPDSEHNISVVGDDIY